MMIEPAFSTLFSKPIENLMIEPHLIGNCLPIGGSMFGYKFNKDLILLNLLHHYILCPFLIFVCHMYLFEKILENYLIYIRCNQIKTHLTLIFNLLKYQNRLKR